jgi:putative phage-type endonuclease
MAIELVDDRAEWLAKRRSVVGASEIAAIIGLSHFQTPLDVYLSKVEGRDAEETLAMRMGSLIEPLILELYAEDSGLEVRPNRELLVHPEYSFAGCTVDGYAGPNGIVEAKNTRRNLEEVDKAHFCQLQYQLAITGKDWGAVAYLMDTRTFRAFEFERNPNIGDALLAAAAEFWQRVEERRPPDPVNADDVAKLYTSHTEGKALEAVPEVLELLDSYRAAKRREKEVKAEIETLGGQLKTLLRDAELLTLGGDTLATFRKEKDGRTIDSKRLAKELPDIYEAYSKPRAGARKLLLKGEA